MSKYLGCFQVLAIVNNPAVSMEVFVCLFSFELVFSFPLDQHVFFGKMSVQILCLFLHGHMKTSGHSGLFGFLLLNSMISRGILNSGNQTGCDGGHYCLSHKKLRGQPPPEWYLQGPGAGGSCQPGGCHSCCTLNFFSFGCATLFAES